MKLLDLFCCEGGAAKGYQRAGFEVTGVDNVKRFIKRYPGKFVHADALEYVKQHGHEYDVIHASPPCQAYSNAQRLQNNVHPDLVEDTRDALIATGKPYIIENVVGAPLLNPVTLCGNFFGLRTYRHRLFETNWPLTQPPHLEHTRPTTKMGRPPKHGEMMHIVGNFSGVAIAREIMEMSWASRDGLREAVPPAYTEYIGKEILKWIGKN